MIHQFLSIIALCSSMSFTLIAQNVYDQIEDRQETITTDNGIITSVSTNGLLYVDVNESVTTTYNYSFVDLTFNQNNILDFEINFNYFGGSGLNTDDFFTGARSVNFNSLNTTEEPVNDVVLYFHAYAFDGDGYDCIDVFVEDNFYYTIESSSTEFEAHSVDTTYYINVPYYCISNALYNQGAYKNGYTDGYNDGVNYGNSESYTIGYNQGYNAGKNDCLNQNINFMSLFGAIADTPVVIIRNLFSFDLFGMSALTIVMSLLTALLVIHFIRKFI